jgi:tetratricopeptide (TPR) repeat protein
MNSLRLTIRICGLAILTASAAGQTPADTKDLLEESRALRRQFVSQKQAAVAELTSEQQDASLTELIEQVLALQSPSDVPLSEQTDPRVTGRGVLSGTSPEPTNSIAAEPAPTITDEIPDAKGDAADSSEQKEDVLFSLSANNTAPPYPMELADVLYRAGRVDLAGHYYRMALETASKGDIKTHQWLLFQTANCLRHTEPRRAGSLYEELIRLYPNGLWTTAAQAHHRTLSWMTANETELQARLQTP